MRGDSWGTVNRRDVLVDVSVYGVADCRDGVHVTVTCHVHVPLLVVRL